MPKIVMFRKQVRNINELEELLREDAPKGLRLNEEKLFKFKRATKIAQRLQENKMFGDIRIDETKEYGSSHFIDVVFEDDLFEGEDIDLLIDFLELFDGFMFFGSSNGEISVTCKMSIYE